MGGAPSPRLKARLADRVSELTDKNQKRVTTKPKAVENYLLLRVADREGEKPQ